MDDIDDRLLVITSHIKLQIDKTAKILEGCRNKTMIGIADSLLFRHSKNRSEQELRGFFEQINEQLCEPPLADNEINSIWNQAIKFVEANIKEQ